MSDRGHGIPGDKLKEVFEPFYTSKSEGMGMGLSIARTIIEVHNGTDMGRQSGSRRDGSDQTSCLYQRRWTSPNRKQNIGEYSHTESDNGDPDSFEGQGPP